MRFTISKRGVVGIGAVAAAAVTAMAAPAGAANPNPHPAKQPVPKPPTVSITREPVFRTIPVHRPNPSLIRLASCDRGNVCLYYFASTRRPVPFGSRYETAHNEPDLSNNHFTTFGPGRGATVANNAEFVWNADPRVSVKLCQTVFYGDNPAGDPATCITVPPNTLSDLPPGYSNNVESLLWADSSN